LTTDNTDFTDLVPEAEAASPPKRLSNLLIKAGVRTLFLCQSRDQALRQSEALAAQYTELAARLSKEAGRMSVEVPPMRGVDEDMRRWSLFMLLQHNAIVNRSITASVVQLANGERLSGPATIDVKKGVMPSSSADESQAELFAQSVADHIAAVRDLDKLRGTKTSAHPIFGQFDAHKWNCMFAFHLRIHLQQARFIVEKASAR
jgi:hypothetical protein